MKNRWHIKITYNDVTYDEIDIDELEELQDLIERGS